MRLIDGKLVSQKVKDEVKIKAAKLSEMGFKPTLAVILVGLDKASQTYVNSKEKACIQAGIGSLMYKLDEQTSEKKLLKLIDELNKNSEVDGILVQLPLPKQIDEKTVLQAINPSKDVDGFHAMNVGKLVSNSDSFVACTPFGIMRLLKEYEIEVCGKDVVIIGRSNIVGKPMALLMLNANATVTVCHSKTKDIASFTQKADIIIAAVGIAKFLKADMVKDGAIVIDVGINRTSDAKLVGDVDFENVAPKCSFITPVPGGVGPMTIAMLLNNTLISAQNRAAKQ